MKYLSTQQWETTNKSLSELFGVEDTPIPYDPPTVQPCKVGGPRTGTKHTPESLDLLSKAAKRQWASTTYRENARMKAKAAWLDPHSKLGTKEYLETQRQKALARWNEDSSYATKTLEALCKANQKRMELYIFTDPSGNEHQVHGLNQFCRANGLQAANMVNRGKSKGWTCRKA